MVLCPECDTDLDIEEDEVDEGEIVSCPECGSDFEVVTANPGHKTRFRTGLQWLESTSSAQFGRKFLELDEPHERQVLFHVFGQ